MSAKEAKTKTTGTPHKIHEVVKYPDTVLTIPAEKVTEFTPELAEFVEEMFETMYAAQGSFKERPEDRLTLINPEIIDREGKQVEEEGCLSLPDIREKVSRAGWVKVRAQNVKGEFFEVEGEELLARALQHEIDHLQGILFIDHLSRLKRDLVKRRIKKLQKNGEW